MTEEVQFVELRQTSGTEIWINPAKVSYITPIDETQCVLHFGVGDQIYTKDPAEFVAGVLSGPANDER